jgi:hypothetical protein
MDALNSQRNWWCIVTKHIDSRLIMRPPSRYREQKPESRRSSNKSWTPTLQNELLTRIFLHVMCLWSEGYKTRVQISRPLITSPSGVQCQHGSYRIGLLGVSGDLPPSQTMSITISITVFSIREIVFSTTQKQFHWRLFIATYKWFILWVEQGPQCGQTICHKDMI